MSADSSATSAERVERAAGAAAAAGVDQLLVGTPANVRYLTGFTGSSGNLGSLTPANYVLTWGGYNANSPPPGISRYSL